MEPQRDLTTGTVGRLSRKVVAPTKGAIPYPHLSDNTLVLSDLLLLAPVDGKLYLHFRRASSTYGTKGNVQFQTLRAQSQLAWCP